VREPDEFGGVLDRIIAADIENEVALSDVFYEALRISSFA
jgi:hypothetical protein